QAPKKPCKTSMSSLLRKRCRQLRPGLYARAAFISSQENQFPSKSRNSVLPVKTPYYEVCCSCPASVDLAALANERGHVKIIALYRCPNRFGHGCQIGVF